MPKRRISGAPQWGSDSATILPSRTIALAVLAGALITSALSSLAWACSEQAYISVNPNKGRAGQNITVIGGAFRPGQNVEIRWNSTNGLLLGTGTGPSFSVPVTIPNSPEDVYTLLAVQYLPGTGVVNRSAPAPFEVRNTNQETEENFGPVTGEFGDQMGTEEDPKETRRTGDSPATDNSSNETGVDSGSAAQQGKELLSAPTADETNHKPGSSVQGRAVPLGEDPQSGKSQGASTNSGPERQAIPSSATTVSQNLWSGFASSPAGAGGMGSESSQDNVPARSMALAAGLGLLMFGLTLAGIFVTLMIIRRQAMSGSTGGTVPLGAASGIRAKYK